MPLTYGTVSCEDITIANVEALQYAGKDSSAFKPACQFLSGSRTCLPNPEWMLEVDVIYNGLHGVTLCTDWSSYDADSSSVNLIETISTCGELQEALGVEGPTAAVNNNHWNSDDKCQWYGWVMGMTCFPNNEVCTEPETCKQIGDASGDVQQTSFLANPSQEPLGCHYSGNEFISIADCGDIILANGINKSTISLQTLAQKCKNVGSDCTLNTAIFDGEDFTPNGHGGLQLCATASYDNLTADCSELPNDNCLLRGLFLGQPETMAGAKLCKKNDPGDACEDMKENDEFQLEGKLGDNFEGISAVENFHPFGYVENSDVNDYLNTTDLCGLLKGGGKNVDMNADKCVVGSELSVEDQCTNVTEKVDLETQYNACGSITAFTDANKECRVAVNTTTLGCEVADKTKVLNAENVQVGTGSAARTCSLMGYWYGDSNAPMTNGWTVDSAGGKCVKVETCDEIKWDTVDASLFGEEFCKVIGHEGGEDADKGVVCEFVAEATACSGAMAMTITGIVTAVITMLF